MSNFRSVFAVLFLGVLSLRGQITDLGPQVDYGDPPVSRVVDYDNYYRTNPEKLEKISEALIRLKAEHDFDVYMVILSGHIGLDATSMAFGYRDAWLDEKNDGLVFLVDVQEMKIGGTGKVGYSEKLYGGGFMDEELMPRIMLTDLSKLINKAGEEMRDVESSQDRVEKFGIEVARVFGERLQEREQINENSEHLKLMGVMAAGILIVSLLVALASKFLGKLEQRAAEVYRFPDVLVGERLKAQNGGGKFSWRSFGSPS